jgi:hypothetical protein
VEDVLETFAESGARGDHLQRLYEPWLLTFELVELIPGSRRHTYILAADLASVYGMSLGPSGAIRLS